MKVINVQGTSKTGKTTTVKEIIKELRRRGYSVGSVKEIHFEEFTMETEGSNTHTHKQAGANPVTARGLSETDIMFNYPVDIEKILDLYTQDYVVIEGMCDANCPNIAIGRTAEQVDEQIDDLTIAVSGVFAGEMEAAVLAGDSNELEAGAQDSAETLQEKLTYKDYPVINGMTQIGKLVNLIEEKTPDRMPNYPENCCHACGYGCRGLAVRVINGTASIAECILKGENVQVLINGEELPMVPFVKSMVRSVSTAVIKELDGYTEGCEITIKIK